MAKTVITAFNEFLKDTINLDPEETKTARKSRNWLIDQIEAFPSKEGAFPLHYSDKHISFGSFARRTKIRELDDIDIMVCLRAEGSKYYENSDEITISVPDSAERLKKLCDSVSSYPNPINYLNSRKVINALVAELKSVPQYGSADISRNMEAAKLNLISYSWSFDVVPCFFTVPDSFDRTYYIIPDGHGKWKKTDPRKDRDRASSINTKHNNNILNIIRTMKYWNKRPTMPSMASYLLETMVLDYYENCLWTAGGFVDVEIPGLLQYINTNIFSNVNDPKGIQGNINNTLTFDEKIKISVRAGLDRDKALEARRLEGDKDYEASISKWTEVFGPAFPSYS